MASNCENVFTGYSKYSQIHQSTDTISNENIFTLPVQPIQNEQPISAFCQFNLNYANAFSNAVSDFYLHGLLTVNCGP